MAEMLCTRLCHDLTGPISAVSNGAEFISEENFNMQGEAVDLIVSSAFSAVARLQFYRFAYGRIKSQGEASLDDKKQLVEDFFRGTNVKLDWPDQDGDSAGISVSWRLARLLFNLLIIVAGSLLKGGNISVRLTDDGNKTLILSASGDIIKWDAKNEDIIKGKGNPDDMDPKTVQLFLTHQLAQEVDVDFDVKMEDGKLEITALQKSRGFAVEDLVQSGEAHG